MDIKLIAKPHLLKTQAKIASRLLEADVRDCVRPRFRARWARFSCLAKLTIDGREFLLDVRVSIFELLRRAILVYIACMPLPLHLIHTYPS